MSNTVRLLQLPAEVHRLLEDGALSAGHARALLGLDDPAYAAHIAARAANEGWSVRQVEDAVRLRARPEGRRSVKRARRLRPAPIIELEERLAERLGTRVDIEHTATGGRMVIRYRSLDDLERIYRHLFGLRLGKRHRPGMADGDAGPGPTRRRADLDALRHGAADCRRPSAPGRR